MSLRSFPRCCSTCHELQRWHFRLRSTDPALTAPPWQSPVSIARSIARYAAANPKCCRPNGEGYHCYQHHRRFGVHKARCWWRIHWQRCKKRQNWYLGRKNRFPSESQGLPHLWFELFPQGPRTKTTMKFQWPKDTLQQPSAGNQASKKSTNGAGPPGRCDHRSSCGSCYSQEPTRRSCCTDCRLPLWMDSRLRIRRICPSNSGVTI